ncbi:MAG: pyridoxal phosphate-dependent class II aminotransferase [Gallionella sp.]|nr:pyridoxal phosphate-dependent class II aminotransferase [Gallionella sp.]
MLEHGGRLRHAARQYGIAEADWLDLSTGINPHGWPVPVVPNEVWQRLPQDDDELQAAAQTYYFKTISKVKQGGDERTTQTVQPARLGVSEEANAVSPMKLLAVAGSQAAIQCLPMLRSPAQVAIVAPSYAEHAHAWQRHSHQVVSVPAAEILQAGTTAQVVVIVNPNNPTGKLFRREELLGLHAQLAARGGWLVVDEAFMDASPAHSLASACPRPGLIVLRSLGKFFGLAGARAGFVLAEENVLQPLAELLGPWPIAAPSRYVATLALRDTAWQDATRKALSLAAQRLAELLSTQGLPPSGGSSLFQWVRYASAVSVHQHLAQQGILTRLFDAPPSVRFGLPRDEAQWARLAEALSGMKR